MDHNTNRQDLGLLLARVMLGVVFAFHGAQKLFGWFGGGGFDATVQAFTGMEMPMPTVSAALAGGAEFFGGVALIAGFASRLASIPLTFTMLVAALAVHGSAFGLQNGGMEYALTLAINAAAVGLLGPGRIAAGKGRLA